MPTTTRPVVAGVDGTAGSMRAVRYAALEAARLGVALTIVHVSPGEATEQAVSAAMSGTLRAYGLELLEGAVAIARDLAPDVPVDCHLDPGETIVAGLASCSSGSLLLVLGTERRSFVGQVWTGDVVAGVSARAHCPVAVVPDTWEPGDAVGPVVVGLKDTEHSMDLVGTGMALADQLHTELLVVHAWKAPSGYDDIIATRTYQSEYNAHVTADIEALVAPHRRAHPDLPVRVEVVHAQPAYALVQASNGAERLLLGRPRLGAAFHHLGGVGRAVLREAHCPVVVHPERGAWSTVRPG